MISGPTTLKGARQRVDHLARAAWDFEIGYSTSPLKLAIDDLVAIARAQGVKSVEPGQFCPKCYPAIECEYHAEGGPTFVRDAAPSTGGGVMCPLCLAAQVFRDATPSTPEERKAFKEVLERKIRENGDG